MHQDQSPISLSQPLDRCLAAMRRTIVHDQEQPLRFAVRLQVKNLVHQATKWFDAGFRFATSKHHAASHVPGRQVLQRSHSLVFRLNTTTASRSGRCFGMTASTRLDTRFLVAGEHKVFRPQRLTLPASCVQVEKGRRLCGEGRIARKDPMVVLPRFDGRCVQHSPDGAATNPLVQRLFGSIGEIGERLSAQWLLCFGDDLTGECLNQRAIQRGKKWPCGLGRDGRLPKSHPPPSGFASAGPVEPTVPRHSRPLGCSAMDAALAPRPTGSVARSEPPRCVGARCCVPLARNRRGTYKDWAEDLASRPPFRQDVRRRTRVLLPEVRRNHDAICETDHLGRAPRWHRLREIAKRRGDRYESEHTAEE